MSASVHGLTALTRLCQRRRGQRELLQQALCGRLVELLDSATEVAVTTGDPIGQVLAELLAEHGSVQLAERVLARLGTVPFAGSLALRELGLVANQMCLAASRDSVAAAPERTRQKTLINHLRSLGGRLHQLGQFGAARSTLTEAIGLLRESVWESELEKSKALALTLMTLSDTEASLGLSVEAIETARAAEQHIRKAMAEQGDVSLRAILARVLNNLGNALSLVGDRSLAIEVTREAVAHRRSSAADGGDRARSDLARSLNNLGNRLSEARRFGEALEVTLEAVAARKLLAAERPDTYLPDLALTLSNLGNRLGEVDRLDQALEAARESAAIYRELMKDRPEAFRDSFHKSLTGLSNRLTESHLYAEALDVLGEVIALRRELSVGNPGLYEPYLANNLHVRAIALRGLGRFDAALVAAEEALRLMAPHFQDQPNAHGAWMGNILRGYLESAKKAGVVPDRALVEAVEAILTDRAF